MNPTWHILRKDALHLRWFVGLWSLGVIAEGLLFLAGTPWMDDRAALQDAFSTAAYLIPFLLVLLQVVIVPLLYHDDPLTGTRAFWCTRPIAPRTLLAAKALFLLLFLVLPRLLVQVGGLVAGGAAPDQVVLAIPEILLRQVSLLAVAAALASVTGGFGFYAVAAVAGLVAVSVGFALTGYLWFYAASDASLAREVTGSLAASRMLLAWILAIAFGSGVVVLQSLTRRIRRSVALALTGTLVVLVAYRLWPWDLLRTPRTLPHDPPELARKFAANIPVLFNEVADVPPLRPGRGARPQKEISGSVNFTRPDAPLLIAISQVKARAEFPDHTRLETTLPQRQAAAMHAWDVSALECLLDGAQIPGGYWNNKESPKWMRVDAAFFDKYGPQPAAFSADILLCVYRYQIAATLPLREGATFQDGPRRIAIVRILRDEEGCRVFLRARHSSLLLGRKERIRMSDPTLDRLTRGWILLNRERGIAFTVEREYGEPPGEFRPPGFLPVASQTLRFTSAKAHASWHEAPPPPLDEDFLKGAELVLVSISPVATCTRQVQVPDFLMKEKPGATKRPKLRRGADVEALKQIVLPENPSREQIRRYVRGIQRLSRDQDRYDKKDPQVEMLKQVGPENVDVLLEFSGYSAASYHLRQTLQQLVGPEHKDFIIAALPERPLWSWIIMERGWHEEARETLLAGFRRELEKPEPNLPPQWLQAVANLRDPSTYDELIRYWSLVAPQQTLYQSIRALPGLDRAKLKAAVLEVWRSPRLTEKWKRAGIADMVLEAGDPSAFDLLIENLEREDPKSYSARHDAEILARRTEARGDIPAMLRWFKENRDQLVFDEVQARFVVRKPASPAPAPASPTGNAPPTPAPP